MTRLIKILLVLASILIATCSLSDSSDELMIDDLPSDHMAFQKMVIAQLSGEQAMMTAEGESQYLRSRWSAAEKELTRKYLMTLIRKMNMMPQVQSYQYPNLNFGIDLLIEPFKGVNIYTELLSTNGSEEYVIIGAHYDTGGQYVPGAIDNGSGMAVILGVLRRLIHMKVRSKNLIVIFFDQEEDDVPAGSLAFAQYLKRNNYKIHSVHTFDLIGWDGDGNKEVELELPSKEIEKLYSYHAALLDIPIYTTSINSSDHYSFIKNGINAVGVSQAYAKRDNSGKKDTPEDKYQLVNFDYLHSSTTLAYEVIKDLMND